MVRPATFPFRLRIAPPNAARRCGTIARLPCTPASSALLRKPASRPRSHSSRPRPPKT